MIQLDRCCLLSTAPSLEPKLHKSVPFYGSLSRPFSLAPLSRRADSTVIYAKCR